MLLPFFRFSYVTSSSLNSPGEPPIPPMSRAHSPTLLSLHLRHNSFSKPSVALPTSQFILLPFFRFSYVTSSSLNSPGEPPMPPMSRAHSPTLSSLHLRHNSFSKPSVVLPTSQLILQPFRCFTYVIALSPNPSFASPTSQALH